jgi:hypothetical protein
MSPLFRDYAAAVRPSGESFRSRSIELCLAGDRPVLSSAENTERQGLKTTLCSYAHDLQASPLGRYKVT